MNHKTYSETWWGFAPSYFPAHIHREFISRKPQVGGDPGRLVSLRMKPNFDALVAKVGARLPNLLLRPLVRYAVGENQIALCLHRVGANRRDSDWQPYLTISPQNLDALIDLLLSTRSEAAAQWLTVTFDDGYDDAAEYAASRAGRFPQVEFLFFVCPEKTQLAAGFRWDLVEEKLRSGESLKTAAAVMDEPVDVTAENQRGELRALVEQSIYKLARSAKVKSLQDLPNVFVGNHTNCHYKQTSLSDDQAQLEYERSKESFTRLFGEQLHFAFPFGTPQHEFNATHVRLLRAQGKFLIWTTERRPYAPGERKEGAVLPRFPVNGTWSHRSLATWIAARSILFRLRGTPHRY